MKKVFRIASIIFAFILFINLSTEVLAAGATLSLSPAAGTFNKGCKFSLQVKVDTGGIATAGTDAILIYDITRFTADKINNGSIYPDYAGNNIDAVTGKVSISGLSSVGSSYSGSGVLATVDFTVKEDAPVGATKIKFDYNPADPTRDSNVVESSSSIADVLSQVVDGNYVIGTGTCVKQVGAIGPTATPSATIYIPQVTRTQTVPPETADFRTTVALAVAGLTLFSFGIFGIAVKR